MSKPDEIVPDPGSPQPALPNPAKQPSPALRVLVVDDNADLANSTAILLRRLGHHVLVADSGSSALESAAAYLPHVVLLELGLPEMDGYEVARRLRQQPALKDVHLVAMTEYGLESERRRSQEAGIHHHLVKPVDPQGLQALLSTLAPQKPFAESE